MPLFTVTTPFNIDLEFSLAQFHKRMFAWMIDLFVIFIYCYVMIFFVYKNVLGEDYFQEGSKYQLATALGILTILLPVLVYHLLFELLMSGRSPGKMLMGIKVMNKEGASASLSQLLLRWILCLPNYFLILVIFATTPTALVGVMIVLGIAALPDIICVAVTANSQRLGDLAAGTVLVDTRYKMDLQETIYMDVGSTAYTVVYQEVLKLTDRDINGIRNLLNGKITKETENYMFRVAYRIEEVLSVKMNGEPNFFLQTLLRDYNFLTQQKNQ
ncbi:MAG: RDD family protein [Sphingobacteriales bacterium]|nr:MAG: RDD family protein [Sphingobacteriales bacterium]